MADVIGHFQHEGDDVLRDCGRAVTGDIGDDDAALFGSDDIDHIEAGGGDANVFEVWQRGDDFAGERGFVGDDDLGTGTAGHGLIERGSRVHFTWGDGFERLPGEVAGIGGVGVEENDFHEASPYANDLAGLHSNSAHQRPGAASGRGKE